jgi:hypothetical protein
MSPGNARLDHVSESLHHAFCFRNRTRSSLEGVPGSGGKLSVDGRSELETMMFLLLKRAEIKLGLSVIFLDIV